MKTKITIFSPKSGRNDIYNISLEEDSITITNSFNLKRTMCKYIDSDNPIWTEDETLESIFTEEGIYVPAVLDDLFERVWTGWKNKEINDEEAQKEIRALETWVNVVTKNKPDTVFLNKYFF